MAMGQSSHFRWNNLILDKSFLRLNDSEQIFSKIYLQVFPRDVKCKTFFLIIIHYLVCLCQVKKKKL